MERAERIRERETLLDRYLDDLGRDDYWEGRAKNHHSRIGKSWSERAAGDTVTVVVVGSAMSSGGLLVNAGKAVVKRGTARAVAKAAAPTGARYIEIKSFPGRAVGYAAERGAIVAHEAATGVRPILNKFYR